MHDFDLCVAWNWEYDADFISLLDQGFKSRGLSLLQVTPTNIGETLSALAQHQVVCRSFLDRASDEDPQFLPLVQWIHENRVFGINSYERASLTWDKAQTHAQLQVAGLEVPDTVIIPPYIEQPDLAWIDQLTLGGSYTVKPAHGGGGVGVMTNVTSWEQVLAVRQQHANDSYLLQAHVVPKELDSRPAWFRVIYCIGQIFPCWWDPDSHVYSLVTDEEKGCYGLEKLEETVSVISHIFGMDMFSTEIAMLNDEQFVVVDYVNDQIDLRLQSVHHDGVPDVIVRSIAERLVTHVNRI